MNKEDLIRENQRLIEENRRLRLLFRRLYSSIDSILKEEKKVNMREFIKLVEVKDGE